jgi:hypothetical protein
MTMQVNKKVGLFSLSGFFLLILVCMIFFASLTGAVVASGFCDTDIDKVSVESSKSVDDVPFHRMDTASLNTAISEIPAKAESWIMDPVRVVLEFLGTSGSRSVVIKRCDASGEATSETNVRIIEDGYLDDSVRGTWYSFNLEKDDQGRWSIKQGREAYRCWRGHHQDSYSESNCK